MLELFQTTPAVIPQQQMKHCEIFNGPLNEQSYIF